MFVPIKLVEHPYYLLMYLYPANIGSGHVCQGLYIVPLSTHHFSIGFWNCSDNVVFFAFHFINKKNIFLPQAWRTLVDCSFPAQAILAYQLPICLNTWFSNLLTMSVHSYTLNYIFLLYFNILFWCCATFQTFIYHFVCLHRIVNTCFRSDIPWVHMQD